MSNIEYRLLVASFLVSFIHSLIESSVKATLYDRFESTTCELTMKCQLY